MNLANILSLLAFLLPKLRDYFSQNRGLNTVSGGIIGSILTLLFTGLNDTATVDQFISWLLNNGEYGIIAASVVVALRAGVETYEASKKK